MIKRGREKRENEKNKIKKERQKQWEIKENTRTE